MFLNRTIVSGRITKINPITSGAVVTVVVNFARKNEDGSWDNEACKPLWYNFFVSDLQLYGIKVGALVMASITPRASKKDFDPYWNAEQIALVCCNINKNLFTESEFSDHLS